MSNLTLSIDDGVLRRARIRAVSEDTSVNAEVRSFLEDYSSGSAEHHRSRAAERLIALSRTSQATSGPGGRTWTRDDAHER